MSDIEISVVIPSIGRSTLERALQSAASQVPAPIEIIVVSNGPSRLTPDRQQSLESLAAPVPVFFHSLPPFSGPAISRNLGAWEASGGFVAFLDDDDEYTAGYLDAVTELLEQSLVDLVYTRTMKVNDKGHIRRASRLAGVPKDQWLELLYRQSNHGFGGTNLVAKRDALFDLGGFPIDLISGEDRAFAMMALQAGRDIEYVDEAKVLCHDPEGLRARAGRDKWFVNLRLLIRFWPYVSWRSRFASSALLFKKLLAGGVKSGNVDRSR